MKPLFRLLLVCLTGFLTFAGQLAVAAPAGREVRSVGAFTEITLANSVTVVLVQGSPQKVELEGDAADLSHLETTVSGSRLRISTMRGANQNNGYQFNGKITVYVTAPTINALSVSGSGTMRAAGGIKSADLSLALSGSGRLELGQVEAPKLHSSIAGSGAIAVGKGSSSQHEVSISGSGNLKSNDLRSETCRVSISGSGNCYVNASRTLDASIMGSGNVYVSGNPTVNSSVMGSGRVHKS